MMFLLDLKACYELHVVYSRQTAYSLYHQRVDTTPKERLFW
jgi:hypothetical protein